MKESHRTMLPLTVASITMFISLFFSSKIAAIGLLVWIIAVGYTMNKTMFKNHKMADLVEVNNELTEKNIKEKKYLRAGVSMAVIPMMIIGLIVVVINLVVMFFYL